ncbi:zinc finger protein 846 isoform X2 [Electrophorus electricus]|uniref:zinc finger protein 846 isoform X2 n=1 Tax=Electrophorus electricus TaxID=8005 RepID=UPI0015D0916C|nr:zinc finger protein 846 isoform X2 [Electrophorus electricus]
MGARRRGASATRPGKEATRTRQTREQSPSNTPRVGALTAACRRTPSGLTRKGEQLLKVVMEQVLEFAVCELTRIVEDSFDDVLLELDKTEREQMELMEQIQAMAEEHGTVSAEAQELEGRPDSASSSEAATQESNRVYDRTTAKERGKEQAGDNNGDELRSPSMLHRLLTLPSQLLEGDGESADGLPNLTEPEEPCATASPAAASAVTLEQSTHPLPRGKLNNEDDEEEEEEGEDDPKALGTYTDQSSRSKGGRKVHVCKECGRKFGRVHLLKAHRQAHRETTTQCPQCGKSFSQLAKLQSHLRTHSGKTT